MSKTLECSVCKKSKEELDFKAEEVTKEEPVCTDCQKAAEEQVRKEQIEALKKAEEKKLADERAAQKIADAANAHQLRPGTQAMYGSEEGIWKKCEVVSIEPDQGTVTVSPVDDAGNTASHVFKVKVTRITKLNPDVLGSAHQLQQSEPATGINVLAQVVQQLMTQNPSLQVQESKKDFTAMIYWSQMIGQFGCDFPKNDTEFYHWLTRLESFQAMHDQAPPLMVFKKVLESLSDAEMGAWREYRMAKYREHLQSVDAVNNETERKQFMKAVDTLPELEKFAIQRLQIQPDISFFRARLSYIRCQRDENPSDTLSRIEKYLFDYDMLRKKLNPHIEIPLRPIYDVEKVDVFQEVLITKNHGGSLNSRVRGKLSKKWTSLQKSAGDPGHVDYHKKHLHLISCYIKQKLPTECIGALDENPEEDGKHWIKYGMTTSLFQLQPHGKSVSQITGKKHQRDTVEPTLSDQQLIPKKPKRAKKACRWGSDCRQLIRKGKCNKNHSEEERIAAAQKRSVLRQKTEIVAVPKPAIQSNDCRRGQQCTFWQNGNCNFRHYASSMRCQSCGKSGHPSIACRAQQSGGSKYQAPDRYTMNSGKQPQVLVHQQQRPVLMKPEPVHQPPMNQLSLYEAQHLAKRELQEAQLKYQRLKTQYKNGSSGQQL